MQIGCHGNESPAGPELDGHIDSGSGRRARRRFPSGGLPRVLGIAEQQGEQAVVIGAAGRAALQVRAHSRYPVIGVRPGQLEFDVGVECLEALLAIELRAGWAEEALG